MKLSGLEQIHTNCWVYFRAGKMVPSALYHQTCPGFLICVPCLFCLVDDMNMATQNIKKLYNQLRCQFSKCIYPNVCEQKGGKKV